MPEEKRAIGYICPDCGKPVYGERTIFALCAAAAGLVCACGRSELTMEPCGDAYRITVPCGVCGGEHRAEVPASRVLEGPGIGLACPDSRQLCCYIGDAYRVQQAMREQEIAVEKRKERPDDPFTDHTIMYEILSELRDIAARGGVSCTCGSRKWAFDVNFSSVDLYCQDCGGKYRIPAATADDIDDLCCKTSILIRGKEK